MKPSVVFVIQILGVISAKLFVQLPWSFPYFSAYEPCTDQHLRWVILKDFAFLKFCGGGLEWHQTSMGRC